MTAQRLLAGKNIFFISPEPWDYIFVSKHHYAMELARRGNKVFFVNPPVNDLKHSFIIDGVEGHANLFVINYRQFAKGMQYMPRFMMNSLERKFMKKIEQQAGIKFDIVWNFENSRFYDFRFAPKGVMKIYFQVDENQDFHPDIAATTADIVFAINSDILEVLEPYNKNAFKISHSFQGELSAQAKQVLNGEYSYQKPDGRLRIIYVGNIDNMYIDTGLFEEVISANPGVDFLLVGPYDKANEMYSRLHKYPHVSFPGKMPHKEIPELLSSADLLILIYGRNFTSSSHKLLEYLGSGKPIVSTYMSEFAEVGSLVYMTLSPGYYAELFKDAIANIAALHSPEKMKARINFALDHTYSRQLDKIEDILTDIIVKQKEIPV